MLLNYLNVKDTELREARDRAVYEKYCEGLETHTFDSARSAADWVRSQPAPRFFISAHALSIYIGQIEAGQDLSRLHPSTREKVFELYARYLEYRKCHPDEKLSRESISNILVEEPAPEFYICAEYIQLIIRRESARKIEELKRRCVR